MDEGAMKFPEGKFMSTVKVGEKGQIVIPKGARDMFGIQSGDTLLLMADIDRGIAIVRNDLYMQFVNSVMAVQPPKSEGDDESDRD